MPFTDGFMAAFFGPDDGTGDDAEDVVAVPSAADAATPPSGGRRRQRSLPPEVEEGRVEYKLKLSHPSPERYKKLVTQLNWRLGEGSRMALYEVGVEDNGTLAGLAPDDLEASLETLHRMARELGAEATVLREVAVPGGRKVIEVLVRKVPSTHRFTEVRVAMVGGANAGKTTLLGVLTRGELDNGRGKARRALLNHRHELETGRTSSVCHEVIGFDQAGTLLNSASDTATWASICERSERVVTFVDLAGDEKYVRTTVGGLASRAPDLACLVVSARAGVTRMTQEHFYLAEALEVPLFAVVTSVDGCPPAVLAATLANVQALLGANGGARPAVVQGAAELDRLIAQADWQKARSVRPIFTVSSVTGENLDLLMRFLRCVRVPGRETAVGTAGAPAGNENADADVEFRVDNVYTVPEFGTVVSGHVARGRVSEALQLQLGPTAAGEFVPTTVASIRRSCVTVAAVEQGQHATLALRNVAAATVRRGMVLVSRPQQARVTWAVRATVEPITAGAPALRANTAGTLYIGSVRQAAVVRTVAPADPGAGTARHAEFRLARNPEYLAVGDRLLFRWSGGYAKGEVTVVLPAIDVDPGIQRRAGPAKAATGAARRLSGLGKSAFGASRPLSPLA